MQAQQYMDSMRDSMMKDSMKEPMNPVQMNTVQTAPVKGKGPEKKFRAGAICATIWKNQTEKGEYASVSLERSYKDKQGIWQHTASFRVHDLPKAKLVIEEAFKYLAMSESSIVTEQLVM